MPRVVLPQRRAEAARLPRALRLLLPPGQRPRLAPAAHRRSNTNPATLIRGRSGTAYSRAFTHPDRAGRAHVERHGIGIFYLFAQSNRARLEIVYVHNLLKQSHRILVAGLVR